MFERMSCGSCRSTAGRICRTASASGRDSVGRWEGDHLIVETHNLNSKSWLNEVGDRDARRQVVERFIPVDASTIRYGHGDHAGLYRTVDHRISVKRQLSELLELACHGTTRTWHLKASRCRRKGQQHQVANRNLIMQAHGAR